MKVTPPGQTLVEFALVLPLVLLLLVGIAEFTIVVLSYNTLADAARQGARYSAVHPDDIAGIESVARDAAAWMDQTRLTVSISSMGAMRVETTYDLDLLTGFIIEAVGGNRTLRLRAVSTMQMEY
ncbi:MAG: pilus assembly protein [Anaerolineae bacterium]|nr:pilus assembly protein [Anaerolineae bacterium]